MSSEEKKSLVRSIFPLPQFSIESNAQSYIYSTTTAQFLAVNGTLDVGVRCGGSRGFFRTRVGYQEEKRPYETVSNGVVTQRRGNRRKNASLTETGPFSQQKRSAGKQCAFFPPYSLPFSLSPLCPSFFHSSTFLTRVQIRAPASSLFLGIRSIQPARVAAIVPTRGKRVEDFGN